MNTRHEFASSSLPSRRERGSSRNDCSTAGREIPWRLRYGQACKGSPHVVGNESRESSDDTYQKAIKAGIERAGVPKVAVSRILVWLTELRAGQRAGAGLSGDPSFRGPAPAPEPARFAPGAAFYCPKDGREVEPDEIIRGYELEDGTYVVVSDDELEALEPQKSREIDLREFVDLSDLPPPLLERGYYLTPLKEATKAYRLLAQVMEQTRQAGIATFVMRDREYLIAIFARNGVLSRKRSGSVTSCEIPRASDCRRQDRRRNRELLHSNAPLTPFPVKPSRATYWLTRQPKR